jgi:uncharacterized membrane protein YkvA (DUF1232 family)
MARERKDRDRRRGGRRRGAATITRALSLMAFLPIASRAPLYARLILALALDARTPASRKAVLLGAAGYLLVGRDLVPDEVPVIGGLDDLVIVVVAVDLFLEGLPEELIDEKLDELGIDRAAFEQDVAQIRRLTPGPVRRTIRRVPQLIGTAGEALQRSGLGPRVRAWITREDPIA